MTLELVAYPEHPSDHPRRRQPRENGQEEIHILSNPSSVISAMSPGSLDGWQHQNLIEMMDESFIPSYNFNSPKPTAKVRVFVTVSAGMVGIVVMTVVTSTTLSRTLVVMIVGLDFSESYTMWFSIILWLIFFIAFVLGLSCLPSARYSPWFEWNIVSFFISVRLENINIVIIIIIIIISCFN